MNLFYKYSHLQRFEQQNEKDGRKEKGQMTKEKGEMGNDKGERRNGDGRRKKKKKKEKTSRQEYHSRKSLFYYFVFEKLANNFLQQTNLSLA